MKIEVEKLIKFAISAHNTIMWEWGSNDVYTRELTDIIAQIDPTIKTVCHDSDGCLEIEEPEEIPKESPVAVGIDISTGQDETVVVVVNQDSYGNRSYEYPLVHPRWLNAGARRQQRIKVCLYHKRRDAPCICGKCIRTPGTTTRTGLSKEAKRILFSGRQPGKATEIRRAFLIEQREFMCIAHKPGIEKPLQVQGSRRDHLGALRQETREDKNGAFRTLYRTDAPCICWRGSKATEPYPDWMKPGTIIEFQIRNLTEREGENEG